MSRCTPRQDICDLYGRRRYVAYHRTPYGYQFAGIGFDRFDDDDDRIDDDDSLDLNSINHPRASLQDLLRALLEEAGPHLTRKQYDTTNDAIVHGRSLHRISAEQHVSVEALRQRIDGTRGYGGIKNKAPALHAVWLIRNRPRRDISEAVNAIRRAIAHHVAKPIQKPPRGNPTE